MSLTEPEKITSKEYRYDSFANGKVLLNKKKNRLPAMGWNSWNAFGSGNTEALTKAMADKIIELGLDKLGYQYLVLDDGCYKSEREDGKLVNEPVKFPNGFKALSDYIHSKGLKFGMYNDIGTNLCAGAAVGTCGHEKTDAQSYVDWGIDFLKVDNCYYLWDNATFSNPENARFVYCPKIKSLSITDVSFEHEQLPFGRFGRLGTVPERSGTVPNRPNLQNCELKASGCGVEFKDGYYSNIGTFDGTNTGTTPVGPRSGELQATVNAPTAAPHTLTLEYATGRTPGVGEWLQLAVNDTIIYDNLLPPSPSPDQFITTEIEVNLEEGENTIRIMNHRRQENTLCSYAAMLEGLNLADPNHNILLSLCEWGKTQPQNWGYKIGDSWRILNDITFRVGADGDPGFGEWNNPGTQSICSQYNKAVVMDEFAGLDKGWNDPDMLVIGMKGLTLPMNRTHFAMWCMMNSPLMLGMDLRRLTKGDDYYNIITNADLIALNQDALGIQAKRIWTSYSCENPATDYITDDNRSDVIVKPLADGSVALSAFNLSDAKASEEITLEIDFIKEKLGAKTPKAFANATKFTVKDLWTKADSEIGATIKIGTIAPCDNVTIKITPKA